MVGDDTVRLMTWNVWWRFGEQWRDRQVGIAATLEAHRPDIVGLQESWAAREISQAETLAAPLGMYSVFAGPSLPDLPAQPESQDHADIGLGLAVLSRWPIRHFWTHTLPSSRAVAPVALIAAVDHPRGLLYVVCSCAEYHAHLAADHLAQTRELAQLVADLGTRDGDLPVILIGDMNAGPDSAEIQALTANMVDAWVAGGGDPDGGGSDGGGPDGRGDTDGVTLSSAVPFAPMGAVKQLDRRIDYVLIGRSCGTAAPQVSQAYVVSDTVQGLHPSDHYAVVADVAV